MHRRFPLSEKPSRLVGDTVVCGYHGFTYGSDGVCVAVPGQTRIPRTARLTSYPVVEQDSFVWVFIGDADKRRRHPHPPRAVAGPDGWTAVSRHGAARRPRQPAGRQPDGPLARDLPARRLHRHPGGRRDADHHGGRRRGGHRLRQPAHGRRRVPAVLRRSAPASRAGSRAGRTSSTTRRACTCCTAGSRRSASCPNDDGSDPDAFHVEVVYAITPDDRELHARLLGGGPRLRARRRGGVGLPAREQPHRRPAGRRRAERARAGHRRARPTATRSCASTSTPAGSPPAG